MTTSKQKSLSRVWAIIIIVCLALAIIVVYVILGTGQRPLPCDTQLSSEIGIGTSYCLHPLSVVGSASETFVPVLIMKSGTNATISILYDNTLRSTTANPQLPELSSSTTPYALPLNSGLINTTLVSFSDGTLAFEHGSWSMYDYTVRASDDSSGYYAILPPFYYGFYPALVVEPNSHTSLNKTELSMWGYSGRILSGEFILPAMIVSTTDLSIRNITVTAIFDCPNPACVVISHSGV